MGHVTGQRTWQPDKSIGGMLMRLGSVMYSLGREALIENQLAHLSFGRIGVLSRLEESPKTQADLCRALNQKAPSMKEMLTRLQKEKLVHSEDHPSDARKRIWSLSPLGKKQITKARTVFKRHGSKIDQLFEEVGCSKKDLEKLKVLLEKTLQKTEEL